MTKKITELPADIEAKLSTIRDEWLAHGLSCQPADRLMAEKSVARAYQAAGFPSPKIIVWLRSPMEGALGAAILNGGEGMVDQVRDQVWDQVRDQVVNQVRDQVRDQVVNQVWDQVRDQVVNQVRDQVRDQVANQVWDQVYKCGYGAHDAGWLSFYWTFMPLIEDCRKLEGMFGLAQSCGWWWPFENAVILTERPCAMHRDAAGRLHNSDGLALAYPDGWGIYMWHGIRVPEWCIEHKDRINKETILAEKNTEIRRAMCEIIGWPRAMEMLGGKLIHADECLGLPRKLIEIDLNGSRVRLLHMTNGTVENGARREFIEGVPSTIGTCHDAVAWQCGVPARIHNECVRT